MFDFIMVISSTQLFTRSPFLAIVIMVGVSYERVTVLSIDSMAKLVLLTEFLFHRDLCGSPVKNTS
ncbi:hypothetical protein MT325_m270R [Paramecium bursaria chlorella virus MT325]|uniref:Uncharacterized protein m270R n=2 Tax=Paramecium bursaria Chlorella virus A1 TaxID=381899 RepID=A7IU00_PBCVM|nr:hypothetical protein FR483_n276R [Paramecium bursaria Chlorella virus FR483]ABT13824.1 hypothetical protein MT325_m270R [Paramecium bursaria chlorella virus MT325]ABT15561.1 hypothetical protein FR483_n276R [Paramecium bursaria Chlorella virus FR483]